MNKLVDEWIAKAEADYHTALREYRARKFPNYDACVFHAQQCIEKYLKAILQQQNIPFGKTHDLLALQKLMKRRIYDLELHREHLAYLNQYAVAYRYPGESATREDAKRAVRIMKEVRLILLKILQSP